MRFFLLVGIVVMSWTLCAPARAATKPAPLIQGLWVWEPKYITDAQERKEMLAFCQRQGFNRLLVQVPWTHGDPKIKCPVEFAQLISDAAKNHIAVEALDGEPDMAAKGNLKQTLATVDAIVAFNKDQLAEARFAGIHWDIEPYSLPEWKSMSTRVPMETEYLDLLAKTRQKLQAAGSKMTLSVDIPMWYDLRVAPNDNCMVAYNGKTKNFHQHIQDLTDYVGIMSYRQHATGNNSIVEQVSNELAYAEKIGKFVCPAFETTRQDDEPTITFYGKTAKVFQGERRKLEDALKGRSGFGGELVHHYPAVRDILEPDGVSK